MSMALARVLGPEIRVVCVSPGVVNTGFVPGRTREMMDKAAEATPLKRAVEADPSYALGFAHLAWTYYVQRNYEDAIPNFEEAIKKGATANEFNYELGLSYAFIGECDKAKVWLKKALAIEPANLAAKQGMVICEGQ